MENSKIEMWDIKIEITKKNSGMNRKFKIKSSKLQTKNV